MNAANDLRKLNLHETYFLFSHFPDHVLPFDPLIWNHQRQIACIDQACSHYTLRIDFVVPV